MTEAPLRRSPHRLCWSGQTDRGKVRKNNEDSFLALQFDAREVHYLGKAGDASTEHYDFAFAVSDGMGGAKSGEFASRITVEQITRLLPRAYGQKALGLHAGFEDVLTELFAEIHRELMRYAGHYEECAGMGATLSLCWFTPGWLYFGHIGDSRIYYVPASTGELRRVTEDDTHVDWLYRRGQLNEREARQHPRRNLLQKALGAGHQFVDPQVGAIGYEPGDRFLLCTDGVIEGIYDASLLELLRAPATSTSPAQLLVTTAVENSGRDNTTALVIDVMTG